MDEPSAPPTNAEDPVDEPSAPPTNDEDPVDEPSRPATNSDTLPDSTTPTFTPEQPVIEKNRDNTAGNTDLSTEKGVIIMRNFDSKFYTLSQINFKGPFIDRNGQNRNMV